MGDAGLDVLPDLLLLLAFGGRHGSLRSGLLLRGGARAHLLHRHPARPLAGAGVGVGALAAHGQTAAMPRPAVAPEVHQALDAELHVAAKIALDPEVRLDRVADLADVVLVEIVGALVARDARVGEHDLSRVATDAVDVRQRNFDPLVAGEVDACDSSHSRASCVRAPGASPDAACAVGSSR